MFCANCGQRIDDDAKFCNFCGASVESTTVQPGGFTTIHPEMPQMNPNMYVQEPKKKGFWGSIKSMFQPKKAEQPPVNVTPSFNPTPEFSNMDFNTGELGRIPMGQTPADLLRMQNSSMQDDDDDKTVCLEMEDDDDDRTQKLDDMWLMGITPPPTGVVILQAKADESLVYGCSLENPVFVGRSASDCNVIIEGDKSISRKHCRLFKENEVCYVEDLNSNNHTFVNDNMISEPTPIQVGDVLRFGKLELVVVECDMNKSM